MIIYYHINWYEKLKLKSVSLTLFVLKSQNVVGQSFNWHTMDTLYAKGTIISPKGTA